jgi:hypothetical protein
MAMDLGFLTSRARDPAWLRGSATEIPDDEPSGFVPGIGAAGGGLEIPGRRRCSARYADRRVAGSESGCAVKGSSSSSGTSKQGYGDAAEVWWSGPRSERSTCAPEAAK